MHTARAKVARCRWLFGVFLLQGGLYSSSAEGSVSFSRDLAPLLQRRCATCHNEEMAKGHYRLDTFEWLLKPGSSESPVVTPHQPEKSELYVLLHEEDAEARMPQKADPLPEGEMALIKEWIAQGAHFDGASVTQPLTQMARRAMLLPAPEHYARPAPVTAMAFSPDGSQLLTAGYREALLWQVEGGVLLRRIGGLPERITSLGWNAKRNLIAISGGTPALWGTVALVDPAAGYAVRILCDLPDTALFAAFKPDGTQVAVGGSDRTLRIFDVDSAKQVRLLRQHADWVQMVAFDKAGTRVISASRDRTVRVLNAENGELETTYTGHETPLLQAVLIGEGGVALSLASHSREIQRWEISKPEEKPNLFQFPTEVLSFAVAGAYLLSTNPADFSLAVTQLSDKARLFTLYGHCDTIQAIAIGPGKSQRFATGSADGTVLLWDLQCGTWIQSFTAKP